MEKSLIHSPTLESIMMVEKTAQKYSTEYGKYQLWKKLPRKMMYQTFTAILNYLQDSSKIILDRHGKVIWIYDPQGIRKLREQGVKLR